MEGGGREETALVNVVHWVAAFAARLKFACYFTKHWGGSLCDGGWKVGGCRSDTSLCFSHELM